MTPVHELPQVLDAGWVLSDEQAGALADGVRRSPFAHPHDALVGFDQRDVGTLIEHDPGGSLIEANPGDPHG